MLASSSFFKASSAFPSSSLGKLLIASSTVISPASIAANIASFPIKSLASLIALSLSKILLLALIVASAFFSRSSKAPLRASFLAASSLALSSAFLASSLALASASAALALASANSLSAVVLAASASFFVFSASVFAVSASVASFFSVSNLVFAAVASVVLSATFFSSSLTLASALSASAWASWITFGTAGWVVSVFGVVDSSPACATAAPVVATPIPTSTDATPTLNLRNEYFLFVVIILSLLFLEINSV